MSDEEVKEEVKEEAAPAVEPAKEEEMVRKAAFTEVSNDMHKYKAGKKQAEARANEAEAKLKAIEEDGLKANQKWEELYNKEREEKESIAKERDSDRKEMNSARKRAALKNELGNVKDAYLVHADLDSIEINDDGTLNSEKILEVANKFRSDYPELIPSSGSGNITDQAARSGAVSSNSPKSLSEMSTQEKIDALAKLKTAGPLNN